MGLLKDNSDPLVTYPVARGYTRSHVAIGISPREGIYKHPCRHWYISSRGDLHAPLSPLVYLLARGLTSTPVTTGISPREGIYINVYTNALVTIMYGFVVKRCNKAPVSMGKSPREGIYPCPYHKFYMSSRSEIQEPLSLHVCHSSQRAAYF